MSLSEVPCLSLSIAPLRSPGHFAVHVIKAPSPGAFVLQECIWTDSMTQLWQSWQELFSDRVLPNVPQVSQVNEPPPDPVLLLEPPEVQPVTRTGRLMQDLGIRLWQWLCSGPIQNSLSLSQGIAAGQRKPLRLRLEIRDPELIALPWEIMQDAAGKQAISLSQQLLFSRTTSDVQSLPPLRSDYMLKILLVLGQDSDPTQTTSNPEGRPEFTSLKLQQEADALAQVLKLSGSTGIGRAVGTPCQVDTLVQPTPAELIHHLETQTYNLFFYSGHGVPAPDGGLLFLRPDMSLNGTELAQVLTRCQVKLAVFNACWGAQPDHDEVATTSQAIPRSSLVEVLIHHGVPAVLGMREPITDEEALSFIQAFAKALAERLSIDQAVAVARQHLLTLYRFNQPAWTLPVLYMHPEFDGELLNPLEGSATEMPNVTSFGPETLNASVRSLKSAKVWHIQGGLMRVGRDRSENDLVIQENQASVSRKHAVIFCRHTQRSGTTEVTYFLEDFSRYGTWLLEPSRPTSDWRHIHRQEVPLQPGTQIKFGSSHNDALEFVVQGLDA